jgi:hypothetical protein
LREGFELKFGSTDLLLELADLLGSCEQSWMKCLGDGPAGQRGPKAWLDVARPLGDGDAQFSKEAANGVDACGACGQPSRAETVERGKGLLGDRLYGYGRDLFVAVSFE